GAIAAVALALIVGSVVSFAFGVDARNEAKRANEATAEATNEAQRANTEANRANGEAVRAKLAEGEAESKRKHAEDLGTKLTIANKKLMDTLARGWVNTLDVEKRDKMLTLPEAGAFREVASTRGEPVNFRYLEVATETPQATKQFANRAEYAFHSAVGLDLEL